MKYIALITVLMTFAVMPAHAGDDTAAQPVMAKATPDQRAWAQNISGRIQSALDAEPFTARNCKGENCTASAH
jgi:hypothetical protein